jgi:hypothetical protein
MAQWYAEPRTDSQTNALPGFVPRNQRGFTPEKSKAERLFSGSRFGGLNPELGSRALFPIL